MNPKQKVVVAISGGVDSAVSAILLQQQGYDVHAVHMQNWDPEVNGEKAYEITPLKDELISKGNHITKGNKKQTQGCLNQKELQDAQNILQKLNIPLTVYNFVPEYWTNVFIPFLNGIKNQEISNPDILCNSKIKFGALLEKLKQDFSDDVKLATGHYAKIIIKNGRHYLGTCSNPQKDQTYFLSRLTEDQLKHIIFPLENFSNKQDIRKIAQEHGLDIWNKQDSRGICFIGKRKFQPFIQNYLQFKNGQIIDIETKKILGEHNGINTFALHQREGLNISGQEEKYYVCSKDYKKNIIYVCKKSQIPTYLYTSTSEAKDLFWINDIPQTNEILYIKTKHGTNWIKVTIDNIKKNKIKLNHEHKFITTPGQFIVFYNIEKTICLGSGIYI